MLLAGVFGLGLVTAATAQDPGFKPIDTNKLVVGPVDATANASSFGLRSMSRVIANTIEDNGFVRTINNLLGRRPSGATVQPGFSPYPLPSSYQSTKYQSMIKPQMPSSQTFGKSPKIP
jgi:hypothetical protein